MKIILVLLFSIFSIQLNVANSQPLSSARVFTDADSKSNVACKISQESTSAAIKSALRYNRIEILPTTAFGSIIFHAVIGNFEVTSTFCSLGIRIQVYFDTSAQMPRSGKLVLIKGELCNRSATGYFDKNIMQERVISSLKTFVDECIAEIEDEKILKK